MTKTKENNTSVQKQAETKTENKKETSVPCVLLHLALVCKLNMLSCSEVSSSSEVSDWLAGGEGGGALRADNGLASNPRSMLGANMRISGTLISLNLRLWMCEIAVILIA